jgi:multicomponent Na+:H+ antiporter subunit D
MTASVVFSWRYFDETGPLYHVLLLVFLGAVEGFALSGDLFNLFVFLELMTVPAIALTGYGEEPGPLQGALNFGIVNSFGAFFLLFGIALLYGRTGALNLAQIGRALDRGRVDGLVLVAFLLVTAGFLVKAGLVPFHFWLSDAYAVAPIPVCVVLSGVMSDLGLHAIARIYWPSFSGVFAADAGSLRAILVGAGVLTALVGGTMAFFQRDLKRLLAFVTIGHVGIFLAGIGLLTARALAGTTLYVLADGFVKGGLFLAVGILLRRARDGDELRLRGKGGVAQWPGWPSCWAGSGLPGCRRSGHFRAAR